MLRDTRIHVIDENWIDIKMAAESFKDVEDKSSSGEIPEINMVAGRFVNFFALSQEVRDIVMKDLYPEKTDNKSDNISKQ